jgi:cyanophycin synthetase
VDVAVLETARGGLLRAGMAARRVDVGAVLNVQPDHLGQKGVDTLDQLALIKRTVVEVATRHGGAQRRRPAHAPHGRAHPRRPRVLRDDGPGHQLVGEHIRAGGRAVALERGPSGEMITIYDRGAHIPLLWTHLIPAALDGKARFNVQNAMFAAAMAFSMGVRLEDIRHGPAHLHEHVLPGARPPQRVRRAPVHRAVRLRAQRRRRDALVDTAGRLTVAGRRLMVLSAPGDRRDDDIRATARAAAAGRFAHYVVRRDDNPRGRGTTRCRA